MKLKAFLAIALILFLVAPTVEAAYVPAEHREEAKAVRNDVQLYLFAVKYQGENWAADALRQLSFDYTNNGKLEPLKLKMEALAKKAKYIT